MARPKKTSIMKELVPKDDAYSIAEVNESDFKIVWGLYNRLLMGDKDSDTITDDVPLPKPDSTIAKAITVATLCFSGKTQEQALESVGWNWTPLYMARKNNDALNQLFDMERDMRMSSASAKLEQRIMERALDGDRKDSMLLSMFLLKGWIPQYKDNNVTDSGNKVDVRITIDGIEASARIRGNLGGNHHDEE